MISLEYLLQSFLGNLMNQINGVLIGSPLCTKNNALQLDALLIAETGIAVIDFKNYAGAISLPVENNFETGNWIHHSPHNQNQTRVVKGGAGNKNPYKQVALQRDKLNTILINSVLPHVDVTDNIETKDTYSVICFQQPIQLSGDIPGNLSRTFHIADPNSIVNKISDLFYVTPHEWQGKVTGYKLSTQAFNAVKRIFLADTFDPFADTRLFSDFTSIDFKEDEQRSEEEALNEQFEKHKDKIEKFVLDNIPVLRIDCDVTSLRIEFVERLVGHYLKSKNLYDDDGVLSRVCYLAPSNRQVQDLIRLGAPISMKSLYAKLYDFENSSIELLSNLVNERETFPLEENTDAPRMLYVLFNAHLVYNFGSKEDDLVKFGSGSLANDALEYFSIEANGNQLLLINDRYFYGHRADSIASDTLLAGQHLELISLELPSRTLGPNGKNIVDLIQNLNAKNYNKFSFKDNPNVRFIEGEDFIKEISELCHRYRINAFTILSREKEDAKSINKWIRETKGVTEPNISVGDVIWLKNRALVPEERDPFSIPKFVISGDLAEVLEVVDQYKLSSKKYKLGYIEITKCRVKLKDYASIRDVYISTYSIDDIEDIQKLKQHIQIRSREIVNEYLESHNILLEYILLPDELKQYFKERDEIKSCQKADLPKDDRGSEDDQEVIKKLNKLDAKWKINKRKENFAKGNLLQDSNSEYFKLTQIVYYDFAWAVNLKSCYGYNFDHTFVTEYPSALDNIERLHRYVYSALGCSDKLSFQNFSGINPWCMLNINLDLASIPSVAVNSVLLKLQERPLDEIDRRYLDKYFPQRTDSRLVQLCRWVHDKINGRTKFVLDKIDHSAYLERYHFFRGEERVELLLSYNGRWEVKLQRNNVDSEVLQLLNSPDEGREPYRILDVVGWDNEQLTLLQDALLQNGCFIYNLEKAEWRIDLKVTDNKHLCSVQLFYKKTGFFSHIKIIDCDDVSVVQCLLSSIQQLKTA
jgi:hypothetical protein